MKTNKCYQTLCFRAEPDWQRVPVGNVDFYQWENALRYRPKTSFKMCLSKGKGIYVKMSTDETNLRTVCRGRDENCWEDSCMEFFFRPFSKREEYINFEITAAGAYLSAFGSGRENRIFVKQLTKIEPEVKTKIKHDGWELELFVPCGLIEQTFGQAFSAGAGEYSGNFFKCGDMTEKAHFGSFSPMGDLPPGFHNKACFAKIIVRDE